MSVRVTNRVEARAAVMVACRVLADTGYAKNDDVIAALEAMSYDKLTSELLALLIPMAFGRVVLKQKGIEHYAWTIRVDAVDDEVLQYKLTDDAIFLEALRYGVESFEGKGVDEATLERIAASSAEVEAAKGAEAAGEDVRQARMHETVWQSRIHSDEWKSIGASVMAANAIPEA